MLNVIPPSLLTKKGLPRQRQTMTIEKLDTIKQMMDNKKNPKEIKEAIGVGKTSSNKWYNLVAEKINQNIISGYSNTGYDLIFLRSGKVRNMEVNDDLHRETHQIVAEDCSLKANGIQERLNNRGFNVNLDRTRKSLKQLGYTYKRLQRRAFKTTTNEMTIERNAYARTVKDTGSKNLIFLDETGFNLHTTSNFGFALPGETPYVVVPHNRERNVSLLAAINTNGIIHHKIIDGSYTSNLFLEFLEECLEANLFSKRPILVMENARIHHTENIRSFFIQNKIRLQFLPPYTPQFNPIKEVFSMIKSRHHKIRLLTQDKVIIFRYVAQVIEGIINDPTIIFAFFYYHMDTFILKAFNRETF